MEDTATKPLAEAGSLEEFKALRHKPAEKKAADPVPATEEKEPPATPPSDTGSESASVSETEEKPTQEEEAKPKHERSLEARIKELRAKGEHDKADKILRETWLKEEKARADRLEEELRTLRTRKPEPEAKPAETAKPEAKAHPDDEPLPKIDDPKYQAAGGYEDYLSDKQMVRWRNEQRAVERQNAEKSHKERGEKIFSTGRAAHPDFDVAVGRVVLNKAVIHDGVQRLENFGEVLYKIGSDPAEAARIQALEPPDQWFEIKLISRDLAKPPAAPPTEETKLKPAVSKVAPPPRTLTGGRDAGEPKALKDAQDFDEFKRLRRRSA